MRPAGSPGTCGPLYRARPTGDIGTPEKPPDAVSGDLVAIPTPRETTDPQAASADSSNGATE